MYKLLVSLVGIMNKFMLSEIRCIGKSFVANLANVVLLLSVRSTKTRQKVYENNQQRNLKFLPNVNLKRAGLAVCFVAKLTSVRFLPGRENCLNSVQCRRYFLMLTSYAFLDALCSSRLARRTFHNTKMRSPWSNVLSTDHKCCHTSHENTFTLACSRR